MMNKEIAKAMNNKETTVKKIRKWWNKNGYKVARVVLFPIWFAMVGKDKLDIYLNNKMVWDEARADEILSYYIPRKSDWIEEEKTFYFADNGMGWTSKHCQKKIKLKDRRWWKCNVSYWGGNVRTYLLEKFELEGFTKEICDCLDGWTEVCFRLNEK